MEDWTLSLKKSGVFVNKGSVNKQISLEKFEEKGMLCFPKELLSMIRKNLRHANTFDRFMDKYFDIKDNKEKGKTV